MSAKIAQPIAWIDTETTGLSHATDLLLEVGIIITGTDLEPVAEHVVLIKHDRDTALQMIDSVPYVKQIHQASGLYSDIGGGVTLEEAERDLTAFIQHHCDGRPVVAGSSIGFDRGFLERDMLTLNEDVCHYRSIEVSTIKELATRWAPDVVATAPKKSLAHRPISDLRESIAELQHYRDAGFIAAQ